MEIQKLMEKYSAGFLENQRIKQKLHSRINKLVSEVVRDFNRENLKFRIDKWDIELSPHHVAIELTRLCYREDKYPISDESLESKDGEEIEEDFRCRLTPKKLFLNSKRDKVIVQIPSSYYGK